MSPIAALDHVQIAAPPGCEDDARRFYGKLLGLAEVPKPERLQARGGVWFAVGASQQLHVGADEDFTPARKAHPALAVGPGELEPLAARLVEAGVDLTWDERRFHTRDPWGNRLEILERVRP
jgi:catechol 2,3-dioxygenase-like lactoylglutathione lyase family enzyme